MIEITKFQLSINDIQKPEEYELKIIKLNENGKPVAHDKIEGITKNELLALKEFINKYDIK